MRLSSAQIFNLADKNMARASQAAIKTQEQISTGKRVLTPADDPVAATKIMQIVNDLSAVDQYKKNIDIAKNSLTLEESTLDAVNNVIIRAQELAVKAANTATLSESDYEVLATEIDEQLKEVLNLVNTQNANGDFVFGGYKSASAPFTGDSSTGFKYHGDDGQQFIQVATSTTVAATDSGKRIFLDIASANNSISTYTGPTNKSNPPAQISVGQVLDQNAYDEFYPNDMVITFNATSDINPVGQNYTVTDRASNRVLIANEPFRGGDEIVVKGVSVRVSGTPMAGESAIASQFNFGEQTPMNFPAVIAAPGETFTLKVGSKIETLKLQGNFNNANDLALALNDVANGNAQKLANLNIVASDQGFSQTQGFNINVGKASATIAGAFGINDPIAGVTTNNGKTATAGDRFYIDSSEKQDILTTLARFSDAMKSYDGKPETRDKLSRQVAATIANLGNAQTSVLNVTASIGARINTLDSTTDLHLDTEIINKEVLGNIRDTDVAEASIRLAQQTLILQAAQQSFLRVSQLNLFARL